MAKREQADEFGADLAVGEGTLDPFDHVEIRKSSDGVAVALPRSGSSKRRLNGDALDVLADVQGVVRRIQRDRATLDELVAEARKYGCPWTLLGFSVGTTAEAARKRWTE
jgi:hypothetical protein